MRSKSTLNSVYNVVAFNKKLAITKENLHTKYTPFIYNDITLNKKPPIMKQNLCIVFFIIGRVECTRIFHIRINVNVGVLLKETFFKLVLNILAHHLAVHIHMEDKFIPNFKKSSKFIQSTVNNKFLMMHNPILYFMRK